MSFVQLFDLLKKKEPQEAGARHTQNPPAVDKGKRQLAEEDVGRGETCARVLV